MGKQTVAGLLAGGVIAAMAYYGWNCGVAPLFGMPAASLSQVLWLLLFVYAVAWAPIGSRRSADQKRSQICADAKLKREMLDLRSALIDLQTAWRAATPRGHG